MTPFVQGLYVSAVGIVVLFITAAIFYFLLIGLQKLFPGKEGEIIQAVESIPEAVAATETSFEDEEIAAVIATAIQNAHRLTLSGLGTALQEGRGSWWSANLLAAREEIRMKK